MDLRLLAGLAATMAASLMGVTLGWWSPPRGSAQYLLDNAHIAIRSAARGSGIAQFDDSGIRVFAEAGLVCGGRIVGFERTRLPSPDYNFSSALGAGVRGGHQGAWWINFARCRLRGA